jgi:hypothetical protein
VGARVVNGLTSGAKSFINRQSLFVYYYSNYSTKIYMALSHVALYYISQALTVAALATLLTDKISSRCGQEGTEWLLRICTLVVSICLMVIARWVLLLESAGKLVSDGYPFITFAAKTFFVNVILAMSMFSLTKGANTTGTAATVCDYSDHQQVANFSEGVKLALIMVVFIHIISFDDTGLGDVPRALNYTGKVNLPKLLVGVIFTCAMGCFMIHVWLLVEIGPPTHYLYTRHTLDNRLLQLKPGLCGGHFGSSRVGCQIYDCVNNIDLNSTLPEHAELISAYSGRVPRLLVFSTFLTLVLLLTSGACLVGVRRFSPHNVRAMLQPFVYGSVIAVALIAGIIVGRNWADNLRTYIDHNPTDMKSVTSPCIELSGIMSVHALWVTILMGLTMGIAVLTTLLTNQPVYKSSMSHMVDPIFYLNPVSFKSK